MNAVKEIGISFVVGYLVVSAINFIIATGLLEPWISPWFCGMTRNVGQQHLPMLFAGLLIPVLIIASLNFMVKRPGHWLLKGVTVGILIGLATFLGGYLVAHKWAVFPSPRVILSALCDSISLAAGSAVIAYVQK